MSRILYIEDNEEIRELGEIMIKREGHSVILLPDTSKADAFVDQWKPHLVITDHELGEGKEVGLDLAVRMKINNVKVVILSGNVKAMSDASLLGISFFMKPYSMKKLLKEMEI